LDEHQLIDRVLAGDPEAERRMYDLHVDRVYRLTYRMTGDDTLAQDFTQETFIRAFDKLAGFRREAALSTWLHSIAMSVSLNGLRKIKRHRSRETDLEAANHKSDASPERDPSLKRSLRRAIDGLSDGYRAVFVLHDVEGYTHEEIGSVLDIPIGTSKARLSRARAALREELQPFAAEWSQ
jgi:RNA polymerase sigma-70 factor (ECF subfamily)